MRKKNFFILIIIFLTTTNLFATVVDDQKNICLAHTRSIFANGYCGQIEDHDFRLLCLATTIRQRHTCDAILDRDTKELCLATNINQRSRCEMINRSRSPSAYHLCIAIAGRTPRECDKISDLNLALACKGITTPSQTFCYDIK